MIAPLLTRSPSLGLWLVVSHPFVTLNPMRFQLARGLKLVLGITPAIAAIAVHGEADKEPPIGPPGLEATYRLAPSEMMRSNSVERVTLNLGPVEMAGARCQWLALRATKSNGGHFTVWVLGSAFPAARLEQAVGTTARYILQEGDRQPREFAHRFTGKAVLPTVGGWEYLWPRPPTGDSGTNLGASRVDWLGHSYSLESTDQGVAFPAPRDAGKLGLLPDALVGTPSNSRTKDNRRRFDGSDYPMVRLTRDDYAEMIAAGLNCFRVDAEQAGWIADEPVFYWGIGGNEVLFPECLYRSAYLGPALFLDEPAVGTRDYDIRPRLAKDPAFRRALTPQIALEEFKRHFHTAVSEGAPTVFLKSLQARGDIGLGEMSFPQRDLFTWATMIASAAWQLTAEPAGGPSAIVFEPPGRIGSRRTLPEMNMVYGCQMSPENPANFAGVIFGFLRGAARVADKEWGVSIYGAVDRADAPWLLTRAYDQGATRFFFWDNAQIACVPYGECLALARHLQAHIQSRPDRDIPRLKRAAEVAILLPPGYDLGHVQMGRGNLWGVGELNLERTNGYGVAYRQVMGNFFVEIERCLRFGVSFDLLWDLEGLKLDGYREVVRIREDGQVEITAEGRSNLRQGPRLPERPPGRPPGLDVELFPENDSRSRSFTARARVTEVSAPVYYTAGADRQGVYHNILALFELFGPGEEDYRQLSSRVVSTFDAGGPGAVETRFAVEHPGRYRLRAATTDLAGRSTVVWKEITVEPQGSAQR
jgi:hypothetical protein